MAEAPLRFSRAPSVSSAGTASTSGAHSFVPRYTPKPDPSYISASSAADHVTHRQYHENYDLLSPRATPINDGASISPSALALLNSFLDSLLYNFLQKSRSTNLAKLRVAILEVLKTKLGREAVASADEELAGLVGELDSDDGADIDDLSAADLKEPARRPSTPSIDWHLESAFKRMRLRVMVFIRLGDFDDEDEEKFLNDDSPNVSSALDQSILSSPAAVYLASVLEYLAEQTLSLAGDAAYARSKSKTRRTIREDSAVNNFEDESVVVEEMDVEKIALNPTIGRLWRIWRKHQRSITSPTSPVLGSSRRSSLASPTRSAEDALRRQSIRRSGSNQIMQTLDAAAEEDIPDCEPSETDIAANIPLPVSERDVDEIEIPGLATVIYDDNEDKFDDDDEYLAGLARPRPRSASFSMPGKFVTEENAKVVEEQTARPALSRKRSNSVPYLGIMPWDWIPASVRRALAKLAEMDDVEVAMITPLPEDGEDDFSDAELAQSGDVDHKVDEATSVDETEKSGEEVLAKESEPAVENHVRPDEKIGSKDGAIAGVALAGAGAAAGAALAASRHKTQISAERTNEVSEPARPGADFVPKSILKSSRSPSQSGTPFSESSPRTVVPTSAVDSAGDHDDTSKPLLSVYAPKKAASDDTNAGSPVKARTASQDANTDVGALGIMTNGINRSAMPASLGRKVSFKEEIAGAESSDDSRARANEVKAAAIDSKLSSPIHIASLVPAQAQTSPDALTIAQADAQVKQTSAQIPERKESMTAKTRIAEIEGARQAPSTEGSLISPIQESPTVATHNQTAPSPVPAAPVANPYHMLYDDVEPEAIGVAKTSNVPIHTPTPPLSSESRPWTPNRGARSASQTNAFGDALPAAVLEARTRNTPSPLRVAKDVTDPQRATVPASGDYDLDKPIDPGRYQSLNRPKESPTIPKFYNQPVATPVEGQRPGSVTQVAADHSPKGSQASGKSSNKRASEELKEREFDALLDRNETVKYTLTPEEIRDVGPYSPKTSSERKVPAPIDTTKKSSLPASMSPTLIRKPSPSQPTNGVQSTTAAVQQQAQSQPQAQVKVQPPVVQQLPSQQRPLKISEIRKSISALSPEPVEPRRRRSGLMAREPRVLGGETKDFVDFIRSCTPTSDDQIRPAALANRWSAGPATGSTRSARSNMVPREPDVRNNPSGELIDFIRSGPQGPTNGAKGSFPPSHTLVGAFDHDSDASIVISPDTNKPLPSNPKTAAPAAAVASPAPPQITRKTRRNRDPYAIDTDDEEDDDFTALPSTGVNGVPRSEDLQDFLRSTSPPPSHMNGMTNGTSRNAVAGPRSASATGHRPSHANPAFMSGSGLMTSNSVSRKPSDSVNSSFFSRKKYEARPAGAVGSFGGDGFHYSTNDLADYLRTSGPTNPVPNGNVVNGIGNAADHMRSQSASVGHASGRLTPSGSIGLNRGDSTRRRLFGRKQVEV